MIISTCVFTFIISKRPPGSEEVEADETRTLDMLVHVLVGTIYFT